ncbi:MAG: response regulator [Thermodesulfobacteriota bacterium]|nr:response regulator [Thermodesulfobacteriota bacterium]
MHKEKVSNINIKIILILSFAVLAVALFFILDSRKDTIQQQHLKLITERYQLAYNTIYDQYEQLATNLYSGLLARFNIQDVYQKLLTADEEQKDKLRQELLDQIKNRYKKLKKEGLVQQLQFHLRNNETFLRLHLPEKFGDNLAGIRETVEFVNREHVPVNGFENGRMNGGYRFVFPITGADKTYLGCLEVSFGPEVITSAIMKQYYVLSNFFILEENARQKAFKNTEVMIYRDSHHKGYYYNENVLAALKHVSRKEIKELKPQEDITRAIYANAHSGQAMSLYDPAINLVFTTIPVLNPVTHEMVAFCTIRSQSDFFINERQHFRIVYFISLLLLAMSFFTFYVQYSKRKILEFQSNKLKAQKRQLLKTQKILQQERDMFMAGPVITFTWQNSENWPVEHVSKNVVDILGYSAEELLNGSVQYLTLIHPDDLQRVLDEVASNSAAENSNFIHEPYRLLNRAGEVVWVFDSTTLVRNAQGDISYYQGYLVDITKTVLMEEEVVATKDHLKTSRKEEQLKRSESLKTMAGSIAHRFNNAMMAVKGNLELMLETLPADSNESRMASNAMQAAEGASQVGSMMLSYVGQQPVKLHDLPLASLVRESAAAVKDLFYAGISLKCSQPSQPLYCSVDQQQIKEVIESILANAVESMDNGSGTIEITFGTEHFTTDSFPVCFQNDNLKDGIYSFCQIKDSGHGISPEKISQIFEPFYTSRMIGRGLGLARTVGVMQAHHGAITVESSLDEGTTFRVLLPFISATEQTSSLSDDVLSEPVQLSGNILLADDDGLIRIAFKTMLERLGFTVHTAVNGQEAVDLVRKQDIDFCAAVLDISMPVMDGIEAMKIIRKINPAMPILLCSGYSENDFSFPEEQGGKPDAFLRKPFLLSEMRRSLEKVLSGS